MSCIILNTVYTSIITIITDLIYKQNNINAWLTTTVTAQKTTFSNLRKGEMERRFWKIISIFQIKICRAVSHNGPLFVGPRQMQKKLYKMNLFIQGQIPNDEAMLEKFPEQFCRRPGKKSIIHVQVIVVGQSKQIRNTQLDWKHQMLCVWVWVRLKAWSQWCLPTWTSLSHFVQ